ncbi:hypothetical protein MKD33_18970, partial [Chromobacterium piscinae]
LARLAGLRDEI